MTLVRGETSLGGAVWEVTAGVLAEDSNRFNRIGLMIAVHIA